MFSMQSSGAYNNNDIVTVRHNTRELPYRDLGFVLQINTTVERGQTGFERVSSNLAWSQRRTLSESLIL